MTREEMQKVLDSKFEDVKKAIYTHFDGEEGFDFKVDFVDNDCFVFIEGSIACKIAHVDECGWDHPSFTDIDVISEKIEDKIMIFYSGDEEIDAPADMADDYFERIIEEVTCNPEYYCTNFIY